MARYTGPKCKLCRREGVMLFLKGARCGTQQCAIVRKRQAPGQHGTSPRGLSGFGKQLREKQKVKRIYGVLEQQFRTYFSKASKHGGEAGYHLLQLLETRLDNVVYRAGFATSRSHARQLIRQGKISVSGHVVTIPSFTVVPGSTVESSSTTPAVTREYPVWLSLIDAGKSVSILARPERDDITEPIQESLIVEYYSR